MTAADELLLLLNANPSMLTPAPSVTPPFDHFEHRTKDEIHECLRCPERARIAYVLDLEGGPAWLDLCFGCASWLRLNMTDWWTL
jgi:hypothetical protein